MEARGGAVAVGMEEELLQKFSGSRVCKTHESRGALGETQGCVRDPGCLVGGALLGPGEGAWHGLEGQGSVRVFRTEVGLGHEGEELTGSSERAEAWCLALGSHGFNARSGAWQGIRKREKGSQGKVKGR